MKWHHLHFVSYIVKMNYKVLIVLFISCFAGALCLDLCIDSCPLNEVFSECKGAGICQMTCSTRNETIGECDCVSGCICKTGFIRDANTYKCIRKSSCPPIPKVNSTICARNEIYSKISAGCQRDCYTRKGKFECGSKSGCVCKEGYIRSPITNQCILKSSCDKCPSGYHRDTETKRCVLSCDICNDSNAEFKACGDRCRELTCENPLLEGIVCPDDANCEPGCFCKSGYVMNPKTKLCIRPKSCPNPCKDINAEYSNCGTNSTCDMQTCRFPNGQGLECIKVCQKGCFCKPGYVKNDLGKCVLLKNCPAPKCKKNEIYECRNPSCEPGCTIERCKPVNCENKCYCRDGYVKNNGTCILLETCEKCDDPNSKYNNCNRICDDGTCLYPIPRTELCKAYCRAGCFCNKGYVYDHTGKCILLNNCPKCPENESFTCDSAACEKNCGNLNETCIIQNIKCDHKCFCKEEFVRETPNGPCIPILKCPPNECKINEVLECRNPSCDDEGCCIEKGRSCKDVPCVDKCYCADGFVRIDGVCVPRDNCFKDVCPANEIMDCRDPSCSNDACLMNSIYCLGGPCEEKCFCDYGFSRINGVCVSSDNCQVFCKGNSTYNECGSACTSTCDKIYSTKLCTKQCVEDCFCNAGFIKDSTGVCIPRDKCPIPICEDPNSEYSCQNPYCEPHCNTLGQNCVIRSNYCENKCYCKTGYVMSLNRICVPIEKCPKKCPANEVFSCRIAACETNCANINETCEFVNRKCDEKCFCADGYVRVNPNGLCIPIETCPIPICDDLNSEYSCQNPYCEPSCSTLGQVCDNVLKPCKNKCWCKTGYVLSNRGICIPTEKCPDSTDYESDECVGPNEFYNTCGSACEESFCGEDTNEEILCTQDCVKECNCKSGFIRYHGECIASEECVYMLRLQELQNM